MRPSGRTVPFHGTALSADRPAEGRGPDLGPRFGTRRRGFSRDLMAQTGPVFTTAAGDSVRPKPLVVKAAVDIIYVETG